MSEALIAKVRQRLLEAQAGISNGDIDAWRIEAGNELRRLLGADHVLVHQFNAVRFAPRTTLTGMSTSQYQQTRQLALSRGLGSTVAIFRAAIDEAEEAGSSSPSSHSDAASGTGTDIFIVHGHRQDLATEVARFVERSTGRQAIILHEQPNNGRTIIEKFEHSAGSAGFAVAIWTGDDSCVSGGQSDATKRARQNVVLETGWFAGRLGRSKVVVLRESGVEIPSDLLGLVYVPLEDDWRHRLRNELAAAGVPAANDL